MTEKQVGNRLTELRKKRGYTLADVGKALGVGTNTISRYETGKREPKLETWQKLADFFGVSVQYLQGISDVPNANSSLAAQTTEVLLQSMNDRALDELVDQFSDNISADTKKELAGILKTQKAILSLKDSDSLDATGITSALQGYYLVIQRAIGGDKEAEKTFSEVNQIIDAYLQNYIQKLNDLFDDLVKAKKSEKKSKSEKTS